MKRNCEKCPIRDLLDSAFQIMREKEGDLTCTDHCCGCVEYFLYDDTPGFREKDEWIDNKKCILDTPDDSYELPQYKGTYEDLLKTH